MPLWWITFIVLWIGIALFTYRRLRRVEERYPHLWVFRFISFFLLIVLILSPVFLLERTRKGRLAILIDNSLSMSIQDPEFPRGRFFTAVRFLDEILPSLRKKFEIRIFSISPALKEIESGDIRNLQATGEDTDINGALSDLRKSNVDAVFLISDGNTTSPLKNYPSLPVYTLGIGGKRGYPDVRIDEIKGKRIVTPGENVTLEIKVNNSLGEKVPATLVVKEKDKSIAKKNIELGIGENNLLLNHTFLKEGNHLLKFEVLPVEGDILKENNRRNFHVVVMREKAKVFLMAGKISWEVKYLKKLLENNPSYEFQYYIRVGEKVFLGEEFPGTKGLLLLVICQLPSFLLPSWEMIGDWLEEGGGLIIIGDNESFPLQAPSEWKKIVPLRGIKGWASGKFFLTFTPEGRTHPIFSSLTGNNLPPVNGVLLFTQLSPAGLPLLQVSYHGRNFPVGGFLRYGKGKIFFLGTSSTWRWKLKEEIPREFYSTFWLSILEYFIPEKEGLEKGYTIYTDKDYYEKGEEVRIMVKAGRKESGISFQDLKGEISHGEKTFPLQFTLSSPYLFSAVFSPSYIGKYTYRILTPEGEKSGEFYYGDPLLEWKDTSLNEEFLKDLAIQTGGIYFPPSTPPNFIYSKVTLEKKKEIFKIPTAFTLIFYLLILLFLTLEWFLRKRFHLP